MTKTVKQSNEKTELQILDALLDDYEETNRRLQKLREEIKSSMRDVFKIEHIADVELHVEKGETIAATFTYKKTNDSKNPIDMWTLEAKDSEDLMLRILRASGVY